MSLKVVDNLLHGFNSTHIIISNDSLKYEFDHDVDLCIIDLSGRSNRLPSNATTISHGISTIFSIFQHADWVFHLASVFPQVTSSARDIMQINSLIHTNTINSALHYNVTNFIFVSSMMGYNMDKSRESNSADPSALGANQFHYSTSTNAFSAYLNSKLNAEYDLSLLRSENTFMKTAIIRLFNVYGSRNSITTDFWHDNTSFPILSIIQQIHSAPTESVLHIAGDPQQYEDLLFVDDAANAIIEAAITLESTKESIVEPIQVGSGIPTTLKAYVDQVIEQASICFKKKLSVTYTDERFRYPRSGKVALLRPAFKYLNGWTPSTSLNEGLGRMILRYSETEGTSAGSSISYQSTRECLQQQISLSKNTSAGSSQVRATAKMQMLRFPPPPGVIADSLPKVPFIDQQFFVVVLSYSFTVI